MFSVNVLSRALGPNKLNTIQRNLATSKQLATKCSKNTKPQPCCGEKPKVCAAMDQMKQYKYGDQNDCASECKEAFMECSQRIENLKLQLKVLQQAQKAQECAKTGGMPYKCEDKVSSPKKEEEPETSMVPYVIGLLLAAAGIIYLIYDKNNKKDDPEKKEENAEKEEKEPKEKV